MEIVLIIMVIMFGGGMAYFFKQSHYLIEQMVKRTDVTTNDFVKQLVDENLQTQKEVKRLSREIEEFTKQIKDFDGEQQRIEQGYANSRTTIQKEVVKIQNMIKERNDFNKSIFKDSESIRNHLRAIDKTLKSHESLILNATRKNVGQTWHNS